MTQQNRVLNHLRQNGSITPLEAMNLYGIYRLSVHVWRLRKKGYNIVTVEQDGKNKLGEKVTYGKYILVDKAVVT